RGVHAGARLELTMSSAKTFDLANHHLLGRIGLIRAVRAILQSPGEPRLHAVTALPASTSVYMGADIVGETGAVGFTHDDAVQGAIGECLERYSCAYMNPEMLIRATEEELGDEAVAFDRFAIFASEQVDAPGWRLASYRRDRPITWTRGRSLVSGAL